jgi:pimeloyl-ACP methyl ester carboxylesterase
MVALKLPVVIVAGAQDRYVDAEQSRNLHRDIPHSEIRCVRGTGHMLHQTATAAVMAAINVAAA